MLKRIKWSYHYKMVWLGTLLFKTGKAHCSFCNSKPTNFIQYAGRLKWEHLCFDCYMITHDVIMELADMNLPADAINYRFISKQAWKEYMKRQAAL